MNWRHLQTFLWLRWRLLYNQWRRAGAFNAVIMIVICIAALITVIPLFIGCFLLANQLIPKASPLKLMLAWDAVVFFFLLFWGVGLITELKHNDPLSLSKFMHLPVSASGAFLINYLSSLLSLSLIAFAPIMLGFALSLVYVKGPSQLFVLALLAAFLLMVSAITYQFQGWLASLMNDPRRRRTIIVGATMAFVLIFQLPNLLNLYTPARPPQIVDRSNTIVQEQAKLELALNSKEIDSQEFVRRVTEFIDRQKELNAKDKLALEKASRVSTQSLEKSANLVNMLLPAGWLPFGVKASVEGQYLPALLALLGMTTIGSASLYRAYRTSVGQYQGQSSNRQTPPLRATAPATATATEATPKIPAKRPTLLLEARIPGLSEPVSGIALGGFRSLLRSPEAKMTLFTPLIMCAVFSSMIWRGRHTFPESLRTLSALGAIAFVLMSTIQLTGNQFGFDRDGFRVFVLSAAPRRDILLGKNLSYAPLALGMSTLVFLVLQALCPLRIDHFLAIFPLMISMFLMFCLFSNILSIYTPVYLAPGSLKASSPKTSRALLQALMILVLFPLSQAPAFLPIAAEHLSTLMGWTQRAPIALLLSLLECALVILLYRVALHWQGAELQAREQTILETVTNRAL